MKYKVLVPQHVPADCLARLSAIGCDVLTGSGCSEEALISAIGGCDAVLARTAPYTRAVLEAAGNLKIIARYGVGVDNIDLAAAAEMGIWVSNTPFSNLVSVAEHTVGMLLALAKNLVPADRQLKVGDFAARDRITGSDVSGKTLGLVGLGRIGRLVAEKCRLGLGMNILAYDPYLRPEQIPAHVELTASWERIFRESDFVSMHLPLNGGTRGIVGAGEFAMMKPTAYFINCARGEVVREAELVEALSRGQIAGAALDVFEHEDPGRDNPLYHLDNVLLTPHIASFTHEAYSRLGSDAVRCIEDVLIRHRAPEWPVNRPPLPRA